MQGKEIRTEQGTTKVLAFGHGDRGFAGMLVVIVVALFLTVYVASYSSWFSPYRQKQTAIEHTVSKMRRVAEAFVAVFGLRDATTGDFANTFPNSASYLVTSGVLESYGDLEDDWHRAFAVVVSYPYGTAPGGCPYPDEDLVPASLDLNSPYVYPHVAVVSAGPDGVFDTAVNGRVLGPGDFVAVNIPVPEVMSVGGDDLVYYASTRKVVQLEMKEVSTRLHSFAQAVISYWATRYRDCCLFRTVEACPSSMTLPDDCLNGPQDSWQGFFDPTSCRGSYHLCTATASNLLQYLTDSYGIDSTDASGATWNWSGIVDYRTIKIRLGCYYGRTSTAAVEYSVRVPTSVYQ